ncbi:MAG: beta-galactosidase [Phycisphaerales bacterium]|nr:beta-galactosidase [Phycisphaerales bacterium]
MHQGRSLPSLVAAPLILAGHHEPLIFRRRTGTAVADELARYQHEHSEETAANLAKRGITWVRTHFYKGFGLAAEAEEIDITAREIQNLHKHGIKVELYTQLGTLQYETLLAEEPGCLDWCAVGPDGQLLTIIYGHHDFRAQPCLVRPGYWNYLKKIIRKGLDIGADGFGFDNVGNTRIPDVCHCPECRAAFVQYLKDKYRPDTPEGKARSLERFGFPVFDHMRPPSFNGFNPAVAYKIIINPVFQEWTDFRTDNLARRFQEIWHLIKSERPDIMLEYNVYPPMGDNAPWQDGIDMHKLFHYMDVCWNERFPAPARLLNDGQFHHRVHAYKLAESFNRLICTFHSDNAGTAGQLALGAAESLAFNGGHPAAFGLVADIAAGQRPETDTVIAFRKNYPQLFDNTRSAAWVAVYESALSLARNTVEPRYTEILALIALLQGHVPFDILTALSIDSLARYKTLILPDVEILTDDEAVVLLTFIQNGGNLLFTGRTGLYDAWRRRRSSPALAPLFTSLKISKPIPFGRDAGENTNFAQSAPPGIRLDGTFGNGRFVYISQLLPAKPYDYSLNIVPDHLWLPPKNAREFVTAVHSLTPSLFKLTAPSSLIIEHRTTPDGLTLFHLLNYNLSKPAASVTFEFNIPLQSATIYVLNKSPKSLTPTKSQKLTLPRIPIYAILELR